MLMDSRKSVSDGRPPSSFPYWSFALVLTRNRPAGRPTGARARDPFSRTRSVKTPSLVFSPPPPVAFQHHSIKKSHLSFYPLAILISLLFDVCLMNFYRHHRYSSVRH